MTTATGDFAIDFKALADTSNYTNPDLNFLPVGETFKIVSGLLNSNWTVSSRMQFWDNLNSYDVAKTAYVEKNTSDSQGGECGAGLYDSSGNGYELKAYYHTFRIHTVVAGVQGAAVGSQVNATYAAGSIIGLAVDASGNLTALLNGSNLGITASVSAYPAATLKCGGYSDRVSGGGGGTSGVLSFGAGGVASAYSITSINGGSPITAGQAAIPIEALGFSAKPTGVIATYAAGAKSLATTVDSGGTATNFNISIQDRIEAEDWPINGDTLTFTFTYGSESASLTQTLVKKAAETVLTVSAGITTDPATWTYWLTQDGFTVEGGELAYEQPAATATMPVPDLVLTADGGGSVTEACQFNSRWRPATGVGAGNVYAYTFVVNEAGISVVSNALGKSITTHKLTGKMLLGRKI